MSVSNPTEPTWQLEILNRETQEVVASPAKYEADLTFRYGDHSGVDVDITNFPDDPKLRTIRQRGHWVRLRNLQHRHVAMVGPISAPPTWDFETGVMRVVGRDWVIEPLEQIMLRPFVFKGNLIEAALALLGESGMQQPAGGFRVNSFPTPGLFPIDSDPPREVREWWQSLTLAGLPWTVLGEVLQLGVDPNRSVKMAPGDWEGDGIQLSHEPLANFVVFEGDEDLLIVYPDNDYLPSGFYPRVPTVIRDPKVKEYAAGLAIAVAAYNRLSNPALVVQGVNQVNVPLLDSLPATPVELVIPMPTQSGRLVRTSQRSLIEETEITIVNGIETARTIRLQPEVVS